jgi:hypothetical protein
MFLRERLYYLEHGIENEIEEQVIYNSRAMKEIIDNIANYENK